MEQYFGTIPDIPFRDALVRYGQEKQRENPERYAESTRYSLQLILDRFDSLNLSELTLTSIQDFTNKRLEKVKEATVQRELTILKAILNKAHREGKMATVPLFPKFKALQGRCRWLTVDEEKRLLANSAKHLRSLIAFALDTGGRRSELLKLDWRNVDLERGRVTFIKTKNGEDRVLRLTERARWVLINLAPKEQGSVFTYRGKPIRSVKSAFDTARRKANLEGFHFHDLRHTFASRLVQKGIPLYEVMHLTGHKTVSMVQRYAHLAPEYQERAIEALNGFGHKMDTAEPNESVAATLKPLKKMVGTAGIEPATPPV